MVAERFRERDTPRIDRDADTRYVCNVPEIRHEPIGHVNRRVGQPVELAPDIEPWPWQTKSGDESPRTLRRLAFFPGEIETRGCIAQRSRHEDSITRTCATAPRRLAGNHLTKRRDGNGQRTVASRCVATQQGD